MRTLMAFHGTNWQHPVSEFLFSKSGVNSFIKGMRQLFCVEYSGLGMEISTMDSRFWERDGAPSSQGFIVSEFSNRYPKRVLKMYEGKWWLPSGSRKNIFMLI